MREAASFIASQTRSDPAGALPALASYLGSLWRQWNHRRQLRSISDLDDHLLCDIGVTREDVRWALDLPFSYQPGVELQRQALRNRRKDGPG
jgi:uncharacterized protein YjiS (DUF1127 family)